MTAGPILFRARSAIMIDGLNHSPFSAAVSFLRWFWNGSGPFGRMTIGSAAFVRSDDSRYVFRTYDKYIIALSLTQGRIMDTNLGTVKDLSSGPKSPVIEIMITPAIVPTINGTGKPGDHGLTIVCLSF